MSFDLSRFQKIMALLTLALAVGVAVMTTMTWKRSPSLPKMAPLPDYGEVPAFSLTERSGRTVQLSDLKGKVWVVDFVFTTCPGPCPMMTSQMKRLQTALKEQSIVRLVSVTVDPETDTPVVLAKYADTYGADPKQWWFLTGTRPAIHALATDGLHLVMEANPSGATVPGQGPIVHSTRFVLMDQQGHNRGYYDSTDPESMHHLVRDVERLLREKIR